MLKRFSAAKNRPVKIGPKMTVFRKCNGVNIKYSYRNPLTRNDVFWRILRKNPSKGVGCSLTEETPKTNKN